jgi:hypothetical protein
MSLLSWDTTRRSTGVGVPSHTLHLFRGGVRRLAPLSRVTVFVDESAEDIVCRTLSPLTAPSVGDGRGGSRHSKVLRLGRVAWVQLCVIAGIEASAATGEFDYAKLLGLIKELNDSYRHGNGYASHAPLRAILDHIPPLLGCADFRAVADSNRWGRTDKAYVRKLLDFRLQVNDVMHRQISQRPDLLSIEDMPPRSWVNRLLQECAGTASD